MHIRRSEVNRERLLLCFQKEKKERKKKHAVILNLKKREKGQKIKTFFSSTKIIFSPINFLDKRPTNLKNDVLIIKLYYYLLNNNKNFVLLNIFYIKILAFFYIIFY